MTIRKYVSVSAIFSLMLLSLALLCPARSMASSGGGCNEDVVKQGAVQDDVNYCFNTDLSGYAENDLDLLQGGYDYLLAGVSVVIHDETAGGDVFSQASYSNQGSVDLNFTASQFKPAPVSGHVYLMIVKACGKASNSDLGQCSNFFSVPNLPAVTY
ncbi:MAG: hypothetical protein ABSA48_12545 [Terracidiphilus sp.]|jgi:hypothetical protein